LEGITRDSLIEVAVEFGDQVVESPIFCDHLYISDEFLVCDNGAECIAIREIDHRLVGLG